MEKKPNTRAQALLTGGICILVPVLILFMPVPQGLTPQAWRLFAVYMGAVLGIILRPVPEPVVLIVAIAVTALGLNQTALALHAFGDSTVWLIFTAFIIGQCFVETGLGRRIALLLIGRFGRTSLRLGYIAMISDLILSPATPSNTARTGGLVYPIFSSVAVSLDSRPDHNPRRIGAYLMLLMYQDSLITGTLFLTAGAIMPIMLKLTHDLMGAEITWMQWAVAMALPGAICLLLVPYLVYRMCPPEIGDIDQNLLAEVGAGKLGPMTGREKILAVLFGLAILGWATAGITKVDTVAVALGMLALALLTGVISWDKVMQCKTAWGTYVWYAGIISLADGLNHAKFFTWMGKLFEQNVDFSGWNPLVVLACLIFITVIVRYFFASTIAFVVTFIPVIFTLGAAMKLPAIPLLLLCAASAQLASLMTHYGNAVGPVLYGAGYVDKVTWWKVGHVVTYVTLSIYFVVGLAWWRVLGLW